MAENDDLWQQAFARLDGPGRALFQELINADFSDETAFDGSFTQRWNSAVEKAVHELRRRGVLPDQRVDDYEEAIAAQAIIEGL